MKTIARQVSAFVFLLSFAPIFTPAQNIASQPGTVNRSLDGLTLLTGPYLLSPAHGMSSVAAFRTYANRDAEGPQYRRSAGFRFVAADSEASRTIVSRTPGSLVNRPGDHALTVGATGVLSLGSASSSLDDFARSTRMAPLPKPATLRFDATLPPAKTQLKRD